MSNQEWLISAISDMRSKNITPSLITLGRNEFTRLKDEVESLTTVKVRKDANQFMGIDISIDEVNINVMRIE